MKDLTEQQQVFLDKLLIAFHGNFEPIEIKRINGYFLVFQNPNEDYSNYLYYASNIDEIYGFLNGVIKGKWKTFKELPNTALES